MENEGGQKLKINWKVRLRSKVFWLSAVSLIVLFLQQLGLNVVPENWEDLLSTVLKFMVLVGVINDPTTKGVSDSDQAMTYNEPRG